MKKECPDCGYVEVQKIKHHDSYRTDSEGRCLTCEGTGTYIDDDGWPIDCPDCSQKD